MDKVISDRLASFNLSMQQKRELIEVIKYVAKYKMHDVQDEIKKLVAFLKRYKIGFDGKFPSFDEYIAKFDTLDEEFKTYIETHKKELEAYVKKEDYPAEDIDKLIEFLKHYEFGEDGSLNNLDEYLANFNSLNAKFDEYVKSHAEEIKKYMLKEDYPAEDIAKLIEFLKKYQIKDNGSFDDFEEYMSNFDSLNTQFNDYVAENTEKFKQYVLKENYPADEINKLVEFLKRYTIGEDGSFSDFDEYLTKFDSLNTEFKTYVTNHAEELKQYVKNETIEQLKTDIDGRFETLSEDINNKLDALKTDINNRFSEINSRVDDINSLIEEIQAKFNKFKQIPLGGKEGQILASDAHGDPVWTWADNENLYDKYAYGIEYNVDSTPVKPDGTCERPAFKRIGNMEYHKTCPIQNRLRGCLHEGKNILHWLNPDGWGLAMDNGEIPVLDGSMGDVGVAMPLEYFVKIILLNDVYKFQLWISDKNIDGTWIRISPCIYSPNKTLTRMNGDKEEAFNACIKDDDETHIGGDKNESFTDKLHGRPRTGITLQQAIEFCENRGNGIRVIDYLHYAALQLLYFIEYANFNPSLPVNKEPDSNGFKQGGLGESIADSALIFESKTPIIPTYFQVEHNVGNKSFCDGSFALNESKSVTPIYFHGIQFGDVCTYIGDIICIYNSDNKNADVYKIKDEFNFKDITIENIKDKGYFIGNVMSTKDPSKPYLRSAGIYNFDLKKGLWFFPYPSTFGQNKINGNFINNVSSDMLNYLITDVDHRNLETGGTFNNIYISHSECLMNLHDIIIGFFTITDLD